MAENGVAVLLSRLASEANIIQGATGTTISAVLTNLASFGLGIGLAFYFNWAITSVMMVFVPVIALVGVLNTRYVSRFEKKERRMLEEAGKVSRFCI